MQPHTKVRRCRALAIEMKRSRSTHIGLAVLSYGFRPLFLLAGIFAVLSIGLWLPEFEGEISIPTTFSPVAWHAQEMLYGSCSTLDEAGTPTPQCG
jgi:uncharacterized protein involved in response to NO